MENFTRWLPDLWLTICYLLATALSLVMLTSISPERVPQQALMFALGFLLFVYLSHQDVAAYKTFATTAYITAVLLLFATLIFGETIRGATRWIPLGAFQLQAGELVKPLLILSFASYLEWFPPTKLKNLGIHFLLFSLPAYLIFRQPDLGTTLVVASFFAVQVFIAGLPVWIIGILALLGILGFRFSPNLLHSYQWERIKTFLDPFRDPLGSGYNVIQSIIAVGSGGLIGKGLGHGTQSHLRFLPERHTDFIFASLAEELGLIGSLLVILCLGGLLYRFLILATHTSNSLARSIFLGSFGYLAFQTFINIGMNLGITPVTGVTLPLISYGGSSILATALTLGIAAAFARQTSAPSLLEIR